MIEILIILISSSCFAIVFADLSGIMNIVKTFLMKKGIWYRKGLYINGQYQNNSEFGTLYTRRLKPFDCSICLSFWTCIIYCPFFADISILNSFAFACISMIITKFINKIIN